MSDRLGTAQWEEQALVSKRYPFAQGKFWLGRTEDATAIGYRDDRHICLISGTRGGKGTSLIINNLCFWPGSAVVVDPKGENATVTAARRGHGSEHCEGMGQAVHVLDPFKTAQVDQRYLTCFNPLDALDPQRDEAIDEASRLANAIVVVKDDSHEPFWDESARTMLRGLILHVVTASQFTGLRNLITVRNLIQRGAWEIAEAIRELGHAEDKIDPPHLLLWRAMELNPAFDGIIAGTGSRFRSMMASSPKTFEGVLQAVANHTEFLDSPGMRRVLVKSDFKLSELKTRPEGMTLYLSLPQRYMDTHYRWLRMMVALTTTEMEKTRGQPASGHPVLMVLDEFAGLKRMAAIETAVAQLAGFGVKLFFVLQSLEQLKGTYKDHWETFLANAGLKIFFSIDDQFTREYVSKLAGETEIIRELHSSNQSTAQNESTAKGRSQSETVSKSVTKGTSHSRTRGTSRSVNESLTEGVNQSSNASESFGINESTNWVRGLFGGISSGRMGSQGTSYSTSRGNSEGTSSSTSRGTSSGRSLSETHGSSYSETTGTSSTTGTSETYTQGTSRTAGTGQSESVHRRPLIQPDEIGRFFARIDDRKHPAYPGLALVIVTGANPLAVKRTHYFEDFQFIDCFSPHPDHEFLPAFPTSFGGVEHLIKKLEAAMNGKPLSIARWFIESGKVTVPSQAAALIEGVPPDNRKVFIQVPLFGKVSDTAATDQNRLPSGEYEIPADVWFTVKSYPDMQRASGIDPFHQLREACAALDKIAAKPTTGRHVPRFAFAMAALVIVVIVVIAGGVFFFSNSQRNNYTTSSEYTSTPQYTPPPEPTPSSATKSHLPSASKPIEQAVETLRVELNPAKDGSSNETSDKPTAPPSLDINAVLSQAAAAKQNHDYKNALVLYRQAADAGNPMAMYQLGVLYQDEKQMKEGMSWFRKAADVGNTEAMVNVAVDDDDFGLVRKAVQMGNGDAMCLMGASYANGGFKQLENLAEGLNWLHKGADLGRAMCMWELGNLYELGGKVPKDNTQAIFWYSRAIHSAKDDDVNTYVDVNTYFSEMAQSGLNRLSAPPQ